MKRKSLKGLKEKALASMLMCILIFNFIFPPKSQAIVSEIADTFQTLICWIGDAIINGLQDFFMGETAVFEDYNAYQQKINDENLYNAQGGLETFLAIMADGIGNLPFMKTIQGKISGEYDNWEGPVVLVKYSVPAIVSNKIPAFNINFFKADSSTDTSTTRTSTVAVLKSSIQKWYYAFRNLAIVALLSILLYLGIKIVLSSAAAEKAKYKQNIMNWVMALVILFVLHYIMAFTLNIIDEFNSVLTKSVSVKSTETNDSGQEVETDYDILLGVIRINAEVAEDYTDNLTYTIMYCVLIAYILIFTVMYLKRTIYLVFLTMIAPLVAVTYPIDKEKDGKSQAFDMWLKEYFFNALLQPIHLILYYLLVSSAQALVEENPIYALVAIGFMLPAEKLIRKMFGMDKYGKVSALEGFAGGAIAGGALSKLKGAAKRIPARNGDNTNSTDNSNIRMAKIDEVFGKNGDGNENGKQSGVKTQSENDSAKEQDKEVEKQEKDVKEESDKEQRAAKLANNNADSNININAGSVVGAAVAPSTYSKVNGVKNLAKTAGKKVWKNKGKIARGTLSGVAGAAGLTAGVAAGIASGNLGNVVKYGAAGNLAGKGLANYTIKGATTLGTGAVKFAKGAQETYQKGYYGNEDEYQKNVLIPKLKEKNEKNKELQAKYTKAGIDMKQSTGRAALYDKGYVNESDILNALKVQQKSGFSDEELVQNAIMAKHIEKLSDTSSIQEELTNRLKEQGLDEAKIEADVKRRMKDIKKIAGVT